MISYKQLLLEAPKPTLYVSLRVSSADSLKLVKYAEEAFAVPSVPHMKHHVTVCYSKTPVDYSYGSKPISKIVISPSTYYLKILEGSVGRRGVSRPALVLGLDNKEVRERHEQFMKMGASFDYPKYQPHVTLTYDWTGGDKYKTLAVPTFPITLDVEQSAEVKLNWSDTLKS